LRKSPNPKAKWKTKQHLYKEASKLHNKFRDVMLAGRFTYAAAFQEVPLQDLVEGYRGLMKVDWIIPDYKVAVELHGKQHYEQTSFGSEAKLTSNFNWVASKGRDSHKKALLLEAGYVFVEIPYTDEGILTEGYLLKKIAEALDECSR
jgi:hypothetical protein